MQSYIFDGNRDPEMAKHRRIAEALMARQGGQMPQTIGDGLTSLGDALAYRSAMAKAQGPFPTAPGGAKPSFGTAMMNKFGFGRGGLY